MRLRATVRVVLSAFVAAVVTGGTLVAIGAASAPTASAVTVAVADFSLAMSSSPSSVSPGNDIKYTATVTNNGPTAAPAGVTFSDTPPAGTTRFESGDSSSPPIGIDCQSPSPTAPLTCTSNASWPSQDSVTFTVGLQVDANTTPGSVITNAATVTSSLADPTPADNTATTTTTVVPGPLLAVKKSHVGNFTQSQPGTYTISVGNVGTGPTSGTVTVSDTLPGGLTPGTATGTGWTCSAPGGATVTCTRMDPLVAQSNYPPITLDVNVAGNAPGSVTNTATVSGGGSPSTTANDPTTIISPPAPRLAIAKSHTPTDFTQGQPGTYTIGVGNNGTGPTIGTVTVTDPLPAGLTAGTVTGTGWSCSTAAQTVTCTRSDALAPSSFYPAIVLNVEVADNAPGSVTNTATVSGGASPTSATANDPTTINPAPEHLLAVTKSHVGNFTQGRTGTYTITVSNTGTTIISDIVTITDALPAGLTATAMSGVGWNCNVGTLTCLSAAGRILQPGGSSPPISVTVNVANNAPASVTNTATVSGGGSASATANDPTTIVPAARKATALEAEPVLFQLFPFRVFFPNLRATLTTASGSSPVPGQTVRFFAGQTFVCQGHTDAGGVASCNARGHFIQLLVAGGDRAVFAGDAQFGPSQARGPLIGF